MIISHCQFTGLAIAVQSFPGKLIATASHPITAVNLAQLNAQEIGDSEHENFLLFCGFMARMAEFGFLTVRSPLVNLSPSARWLELTIQPLAKIANWIALNSPAKLSRRVPAFVITKATTPENIGAWLTECQSAIDELVIMNRAQRVRAEREEWYDIEDSSIPKLGDAQKLKGIEQYIHRSFFERSLLELDAFYKVRNAATAPAKLNYHSLVWARAIILDLGLEVRHEDMTDKQLIVAAIDKAILAKSSILDLMKRSESGEENEFRIVDESQINATKIEVPTAEPRKEDYPNMAAFIIARKKWQESK